MEIRQPNLEIISDDDVLVAVELDIRPLIGHETLLNRGWMLSNAWVAVPAELGRDEEDIEQTRIVNAIRATGCEWCLGFPLAEVTLPSSRWDCYKISATLAGYRLFMRARLVFRYLVVPPDRTFAILMDDDVYVVAGSRKFVVAALGVDLNTARDNFHEMVVRWQGYNEHARKYFNELDGYYRQFKPE